MTKDQLKLLSINGNSEVKFLAEQVLQQRKADKLASSYFSNFLKDNVNGFVHPSVRTMGARTGRMSITDPALQTLPSGDSTVRKAFIPKDEDHVIISSDLDQVEFRLTAAFSQDEQLISLFHEADQTGGDVFTSIMQQVYQDNTLEKSDPRRKLIKGVIYGKLYGAGVDKMALTAGVQTHIMREVVDAFDSNYPGVKRFQKAVEDAGMRRLNNEGTGYVMTRTGRRLPCDEDRVYSLTNYLIQATAAEVFKMNLIKLDQADLTEYLIVPVHDEIVLQAPRDEAPEVMEVVRQCMTTTEGWAVPLTAGVEGPFESWGDKY
jgi:DNA polymerase-1